MRSSALIDWLTSPMNATNRPYDPTRAYALSKLANVLHTRALADRLREMGANVTANCVHPGIVRTRLIRDRDGLITSTPAAFSSLLHRTFLSESEQLLVPLTKTISCCHACSLQTQSSSWRPSSSRRFLRSVSSHHSSDDHSPALLLYMLLCSIPCCLSYL